MTISQWLCENQILASIILTIISLGLGLFLIITVANFMLNREIHTGQEYNPELKAKQEKRYKIYQIIIMSGMYIGLGLSLYFNGFVKSLIIFISTIFLTLVSLSGSKNKTVSSFTNWLCFGFVAVFTLGCLGFIIKQLYDWYILHICHF